MQRAGLELVRLGMHRCIAALTPVENRRARAHFQIMIVYFIHLFLKQWLHLGVPQASRRHMLRFFVLARHHQDIVGVPNAKSSSFLLVLISMEHCSPLRSLIPTFGRGLSASYMRLSRAAERS